MSVCAQNPRLLGCLNLIALTHCKEEHAKAPSRLHVQSLRRRRNTASVRRRGAGWQRTTSVNGVRRRQQKQVAQAEFWRIDLSGWEQLKRIQGLSWKHSCSRHGTGHAWEGTASRDPLWLPQCLLPLEAHRVLTQPQQTALLQGTACSKHELAQVLLPRHRGRDSSHRFGTPDSHAAQERLVS